MLSSILLAVRRFPLAGHGPATLARLSDCNDTVMVIIGILAAIAVPTYLSQQGEAKDTAAKAQLRTAATAQQLYYAEENTYATNAADLEVHGFRQGDQRVEVKGASGSAYCMEAPGGGGTFKISAATGKPEPGTCPP